MNISNYRWIVLFIGVLTQMTFSIGYAGVAVSGVILRKSYQFELSQIGLLLGCMALGIAISELVWGMLTDYLGDKIVLMIGLLGSGFTFLILGLVSNPNNTTYPNYYLFAVLLILAGIFGGSVNSSSGRAVMSWFQDNQRGLAMSIRQTAIPIGAGIGAFLIPNIAEKFSFSFAFVLLFILSLLSTLSVLIWLKKYEESNKELLNQSIDKITVKSPYKRWEAWKLAIIGGVLTFPQMAVLTFGSVYLNDTFFIKTLYISILLGMIQLIGGGLRIVMGALSDKYKNRNKLLIYISLILGILGILLGFLANNIIFALILLILLGVLANSWTGIAYTEIAEVAGIEYSGRALGMIGTTVFISSFIIPYIIPFIIKHLNWNGLWVLIGIFSLLIIFIIPKKRREKVV